MARKVAFEIAGLKPGDYVEELGTTVDDSLMRVHRCYAPIVFELMKKFEIKGMAHITGGGIQGNLNRVLPKNCDAQISKATWPVLPIFNFLKEAGNIDPDDIYSAFNMGIGYVLVVDKNDSDNIEKVLTDMNEKVYRIGSIIKGTGKVILTD